MTEIQKVRQKIDELADILQSMRLDDPDYYRVSRYFETQLKELRWLEANPEVAYKDDDWRRIDYGLQQLWRIRILQW